MAALVWLILAAAIAPLAVGLFLMKPSRELSWPFVPSVLLCALAFNLTFFWQELWLVIPKALTPGLHAVLYHNNHDWTGNAPIAELLQGTGAVATLVSGLAFIGILAAAPRASATWRLFSFWMAFQGLFQSLTQLAIGAVLPGNDAGRALAYLHAGGPARMALLILAVAGMGLSGAFLARACPMSPGMAQRGRGFGYGALLVVLVSVVLVIPFRLPRNMIEVVLIPLIVDLVGAGWFVLGAALVRQEPGQNLERTKPSIKGPALALGATLLFFQLVLRPGIAF